MPGIQGPQGIQGDKGPVGPQGEDGTEPDMPGIALHHERFPPLLGTHTLSSGGEREYAATFISHEIGPWMVRLGTTGEQLFNVVGELDPTTITTTGLTETVGDSTTGLFTMHRHLANLPEFDPFRGIFGSAHAVSAFVTGPTLTELPTGTINYSGKAYGYIRPAMNTTPYQVSGTVTMSMNMGTNTGTFSAQVTEDVSTDPDTSETISTNNLKIDMSDGSFIGITTNTTSNTLIMVEGSFGGSANNSSVSGVYLSKNTETNLSIHKGVFAAHDSQ